MRRAEAELPRSTCAEPRPGIGTGVGFADRLRLRIEELRGSEDVFERNLGERLLTCLDCNRYAEAISVVPSCRVSGWSEDPGNDARTELCLDLVSARRPCELGLERMDPRLRDLARRWLEARGCSLLPSWSALDPETLGCAMPFLALCDRPSPGEPWTWRLVGSAVAGTLGHAGSAIDGAGGGGRFLAMLDRVGCRDAMSWQRGNAWLPTSFPADCCHEGIFLPLRGEASGAAAVLGMVVPCAAPECPARGD